MTYQEYLNTRFSENVNEQEFDRLKDYAEVSVKNLISSLVPIWVDTSICADAIREAIVIQIGYLKKQGLDNMSTGQQVKSEGLDGYSKTYSDSITIGGTSVSLFAQKHLENVFRTNNLMYRGL